MKKELGEKRKGEEEDGESLEKAELRGFYSLGLDMFISRPFFGSTLSATSALRDHETFNVTDPEYVKRERCGGEGRDA